MSGSGDRTLACSACGKQFVFTEGEQEFFRTKGFVSPPKRCPDCRRERRDRGKAPGSQVYRSPSFPSGLPEGGDYRSPGFREYNVAAGSVLDRARRPTYPATCAQCGSETQLPFRPVEGKQYYCKSCYRDQKG